MPLKAYTHLWCEKPTTTSVHRPLSIINRRVCIVECPSSNINFRVSIVQDQSSINLRSWGTSRNFQIFGEAIFDFLFDGFSCILGIVLSFSICHHVSGSTGCDLAWTSLRNVPSRISFCPRTNVPKRQLRFSGTPKWLQRGVFLLLCHLPGHLGAFWPFRMLALP